MSNTLQRLVIPPLPEVSGARGRLLVVDDNATERLPMRLVLENEGFDIVEAACADEALQRMEEERFDGIILDVVMPGMNGFELCETIRRMPDGTLLPVLLVTGLDDVASITRAYQAGATDFITKPVNWDLLGHRVRYLLRTNRQARELDARKRALQEKQALLDAFLGNSSAAISIKEPDGSYQMVNPEFERLCAPEVRRIIGQRDRDLFPADFAALVERHDQQVLDSGAAHSFEERRGIPGNETVQVSVRFPLYSAQGDLRGLGCISTDVTEMRRAHNDLLLARRVINNAREAIFITDGQGHILDVNSAFEAMSGYSRSDVVGQTPQLFRSDRHDGEFYDQLWHCLRTTGQWEGEIWERRRDGEVYPKHMSITSVQSEDGALQYFVAISTDISRQKAAEQQLEQLAFYDSLTGLPNRTLFRDRLTHEIEGAQRRETGFGLLYLDLDRFKFVNDSLGHDRGDTLLVHVAQRIRDCVRKSDTVARMGGDEFCVLLSSGHADQVCGSVAEKIIEALRRPFLLQERQVFIGVSIGIATFPQDAQDAEGLTRNADTAMFQAKELGGGGYRYFSAEMNARNMRRLEMEEALHLAVGRGELELHYQPRVDLKQNRIVGVEALVRWNHPQRGMVSPAEFIPLAEENGLILSIGEWVLETACRQARSWLDAGVSGLRVAVNLSGRQFQDPALLEKIRDALARYQLAAGSMELEITESVTMQDVEQTAAIVQQLRDLGLHLSVDDFGTGYSSLNYLKKLPLDCLKVDQSFVRDLTRDSDDAAIVDSIISMAHAMSLKVVAEGVEEQAQLDYLRQRGCDEVQGYLLSRPLPADKLTDLLLPREIHS
ncbi:MAG: EAL domain-containing protein [Magnetococcus sp. WYHC-3]